MKNFLNRLKAMTVKEFYQIVRDPSSIFIGLLLPIILIVIFGYGVSLDIENIPIAVVTEKSTPLARDILSGFNGSKYFSPRYASSMHEAEELMQKRLVDAIIRTPDDFDSKFKRGNAEVQIIIHGIDSMTGTLINQYVAGLIKQKIQAELLVQGKGKSRKMSSAVMEMRMWFNEASLSRWYLVPGLIVIIITIVGSFLTALVMAREWERGTLESIFVTPVGRMEILLSKIIPYCCIGMLGLFLCLISARVLFDVPMRGSFFAFLLCSLLYLFVSLGMGLLISSAAKNQFLSCEIAIIASFFPAVMLSGFIFDLRSVPDIVRIVGHILPATYYMEMLKTVFLAGDNWKIISIDCLALVGYLVIFMSAAFHLSRKKLG